MPQGGGARVREPQAATAEVGFKDTVFLEQVRDDLLLVTLEPPGNHSDEHVENHGLPSGWRQRQYEPVQYTPNLRNFNGVETAEIFNHTGCHSPQVLTFPGAVGLPFFPNRCFE